MTNFEYLKQLDDVNKVGQFICKCINVKYADSDDEFSNCNLCPFNSLCSKDNNGIVAWLNSEKGRLITWMVE